MKKNSDEEPIALEAYESFAEVYAAKVDKKDYNAYIELPGTLSLLPDVKGKMILDAGAGSGRYSEWLVDKGAQVLAIDVSPKMVKLAQQRLKGRAEVRLASLLEPLTFIEENTFDMVFSALVLDYIRDWHRLFKEFFRILRPDGLLVFSVCHPFTMVKYSPSGNYFQTEFLKITWTGFGKPVEMPSYRRSLSAMFEPLTSTGFLVQRIIEHQPTKECKEKFPETYEKTSEAPTFIGIRARKPRQ